MNQETEKVIREYRLTLVAFCFLTVIFIGTLAFLVWVALPDIQYKVTVQGLNDVLDAREAQITP